MHRAHRDESIQGMLSAQYVLHGFMGRRLFLSHWYYSRNLKRWDPAGGHRSLEACMT